MIRIGEVEYNINHLLPYRCAGWMESAVEQLSKRAKKEPAILTEMRSKTKFVQTNR